MSAGTDGNRDARLTWWWGSDRRCAATDRTVGRLLHLERGQAVSLECHASSEELVVVLHGSLDVLLEGERGQLCAHRLKQGMSTRLLPGRRHRYIGVTHADVLEVISPDRNGAVGLDGHADRHHGPVVAAGAR